MPKPPVKSSAYAEYLYFQVQEYFLRQGSAFTCQELADFAGLKVTSNFRRRIRHCVVSGTLAVSTTLVHDKGHSNVYYQPALNQEEIPF